MPGKWQSGRDTARTGDGGMQGPLFLRAARLSVARTKSWVEQVGMEVSERALHQFVGNKLTLHRAARRTPACQLTFRIAVAGGK